MRWSKVNLSFLSLLAVSALPLSAHALTIEFCMPDCVTGTKHTVVSTAAQTSTVDGVTTTTVPVPSFLHPAGGLTISATIEAQQSGTLQKISFPQTLISAGSSCTTTAPCRLQIVATSDPCDFPTEKPAGGYPAGVFMLGSFTGTQTFNNGDTISMTGEASGATSSSSLEECSIGSTAPRPVAQPVAIDVINTTPGTGPANVAVSLPRNCAGDPNCVFMATTIKKGFSTDVTETVQQACANEATSCLTRLKTTVNVALKRSGNTVSLPIDHMTTNPDPEPDPAKKKNPTIELTKKLAPAFGGVDVNHLAVGDNDFVLTAKLKLGADNQIDPVRDEVYLSVGPFSMSILPNRFKRLLQGKLFTFLGKVDGRDVAATFVRDRTDSNVWTFLIGVHNVKLEGLPQPPLEVPVTIGVGTDTGKDLVTARFF